LNDYCNVLLTTAADINSLKQFNQDLKDLYASELEEQVQHAFHEYMLKLIERTRPFGQESYRSPFAVFMAFSQ
jgi:hypothetical protein